MYSAQGVVLRWSRGRAGESACSGWGGEGGASEVGRLVTVVSLEVMMWITDVIVLYMAIFNVWIFWFFIVGLFLLDAFTLPLSNRRSVHRQDGELCTVSIEKSS